MVNRGLLIGLYVAAGALELSGIVLTAWDLRGKIRAARRFETPAPPADARESILAATVQAGGGTTWSQIEGVGNAVLAALDGKLLRFAALLLALGVIVGTVANILSAV